MSDSTPSQVELTPAASRRGRWRWLPVAVLLVLSLVVSAVLWRTRLPAAPAVPQVSVTDMHPAVAEAIERQRRRVESAPQSADAWGIYGMYLLQHDRPHEALRCFQQAAQLQPDHAQWQFYAGTVLEQTDYQAALQCYERAAAVAPDYVPLLLRQADLLVRLNQREQAEHVLQQILARAPQTAAAWVQRLRLARSAGELDRSEQLLLQARAAQAVSRELLTEVATLQLLAGNTAAAQAARTEAGQLPPASLSLADPWMDALRQLDVSGVTASVQADRWRQQGQWQHAASSLAALARQFPERSRAALNHATLLLDAGQTAAAIGELEQLANRFPDDPLIRFHLAAGRFQQGDLAAAEQLLLQATRLKPDFGPALAALSDIYARTGRQQLAVTACEQAVSANPEDITLHLTLAELHVQSQQWSRAAAALQAAAALPTADAQLTARLAALQKQVQEHSASPEP